MKVRYLRVISIVQFEALIMRKIIYDLFNYMNGYDDDYYDNDDISIRLFIFLVVV